MHAATRNVFRVVTQVQKCVQRCIGYQPDIASSATITAGRTTARHEFLATKCGHAVTAVPSLNANFSPIDKHDCSTQTCNQRASVVPTRSWGREIKNANPVTDSSHGLRI